MFRKCNNFVLNWKTCQFGNHVEMCLLFDFTKMVDLATLQQFYIKLEELSILNVIIVVFSKNSQLDKVVTIL